MPMDADSIKDGIILNEKDFVMNEKDDTVTLNKVKEKSVFDFLSSGKTGIWPEDVDKMAANAGIHSMNDLQNFVAICRPGPLAFWEDYINNAPCHLPEATRIAESTHNVLLYIEQIEEALQLLTGCTPDEAAEFRKKNSSIKLDHISRDSLLKKIADHKKVSVESAEDVYRQWLYYARYSCMRYSQAKKVAQGIYEKVLEHQQNKRQ